MAASQDPVVRHSRRNLGPIIAYVLLAGATAAAFAFGVSAKNESNEARQAVRAAGPPCVDVASGPAVIPSRGCRRFYAAIANLCAQDPEFCRRSQKRAAKQASSDATGRQLELAQADVGSGGGGGSGGGNNPNSQPPPPGNGGGQGNGGGNGGGGQPTAPTTPETPPQQPPTTTPGPQPPSDTPLIDVPNLLDDGCKLVKQAPLGPVIRICP